MTKPDKDTPDFDSMSPKELMAWMETLAERQKGTEKHQGKKGCNILSLINIFWWRKADKDYADLPDDDLKR